MVGLGQKRGTDRRKPYQQGNFLTDLKKIPLCLAKCEQDSETPLRADRLASLCSSAPFVPLFLCLPSCICVTCVSHMCHSCVAAALIYRHELGMNYARVLPDLIVGSCLQASIARAGHELRFSAPSLCFPHARLNTVCCTHTCCIAIEAYLYGSELRGSWFLGKELCKYVVVCF